MREPICPRCQTAAHLQLVSYDGLHRESRGFSSWGEMEIVTSPHDVEPVARYRCTGCGYHDSHVVPRTWDPARIREACAGCR